MLRLLKKKSDAKSELESALGNYELPSFPATVMTVLEALRDEDSETQRIADLIAADPGLTMRMLGTVNSAAFAMRHRVQNVHHAVMLLGRNQLESMMIGLGVKRVLPRVDCKGFELDRFWSTSALRAATAGMFADRIDPSRRSESFTASLLQDMAIPVLAEQKQEYGEILQEWHHSRLDLTQLEQQTFPFDHAHVALWICQSWDLPQLLTEAIGSHHGTAEQEIATLPAARLVSPLREVNEDAGIEQLVELAHRDYSLAKDESIEIVDSARESSLELAKLLR